MTKVSGEYEEINNEFNSASIPIFKLYKFSVMSFINLSLKNSQFASELILSMKE